MSGTVTGDAAEALPEKVMRDGGSDKRAPGSEPGKTAPATAAKKAAAGSRKTATPKKRGGKKTTESKRTTAKSTSGKKNTRRSSTRDNQGPGKSAGGTGRDPERVAVAEASTGAAEEAGTPAAFSNSSPDAAPPPDPKSLSWMAAQAVSALNAVKASQAEKLQAMRAAAEHPAGESQPARSPDTVTKPVEEAGRRAAVGGSGQSQPGGTPERQPAASTEQLIAARATARQRMSLRPVLLVALIAIAGWLGYRYWSGGMEPVEVAEVPEAAVIESLKKQNITDVAVPRNAAITVVADEPVINPGPVTAGNTAGQAAAVSREPDSPTVVVTPAPESRAAVVTAAPEFPTAGETAAMPGVQPADSAGQQEAENPVVEPPAEPTRVAETPAIAPAKPSPAMTGEAMPPASRRVTQPSQPRNRNPGYGYYPRQRSWQQPYPNPGYSQYPPR